MKNIIYNQHVTAAANSLKRLGAHAVSSFFIILMLAIALALPLTLYLTVKSFDPIFNKLTLNPTLTVFMSTDTTAAQNRAIAARLKNNSAFGAIKFTGKEEAMHATSLLLNEPDLARLFEQNPLPDAFILTTTTTDPEIIAGITADLKKLPQVEEVLVDSQWVKTLYFIKHFLIQVLFFLAITLGFAFILMTYNTIRLQILSCKDEIEISYLLGAPGSFVRRAFLYQALWQALLTVLSGLIISSVTMLIAYRQAGFIFSPYGIQLQESLFAPKEILLITLLVMVLGLIGAAWATWQFLREYKRQVF